MGNHNNHHHIDISYNPMKAYSYTLLLHVGANTFGYAIAHQNRLLASSQNNKLDELYHPNELSGVLLATYKKVVIGLPATGLTLVPNSLFSENHVTGFARFLDVKNNERVLAQPLDEQNTIIYKTSAEVIAGVEKFDLQNTVYTAKGWINAIAQSNPSIHNLYLEISAGTVQVLYFTQGNLRFYNTFEFKNEDELVYFTAFVCQELNLNPQHTTLILSGDVDSGDKNMARLAHFYKKVELNNLTVLELPGQLPAHKVLALAALLLCAL